MDLVFMILEQRKLASINVFVRVDILTRVKLRL